MGQANVLYDIAYDIACPWIACLDTPPKAVFFVRKRCSLLRMP